MTSGDDLPLATPIRSSKFIFVKSINLSSLPNLNCLSALNFFLPTDSLAVLERSLGIYDLNFPYLVVTPSKLK